VKHVRDLLRRPSDLDLLLVQVEFEEIRDPLNVAALAEESLEDIFNVIEDLKKTLTV
jgi:predicted nucleotidyltransferase